MFSQNTFTNKRVSNPRLKETNTDQSWKQEQFDYQQFQAAQIRRKDRLLKMMLALMLKEQKITTMIERDLRFLLIADMIFWIRICINHCCFY